MVLKHKDSRRVFLLIFLIFAFQKGSGQTYLEKPNVATSNLRRDFPNTKNGIFIFYDQLPFGLTAAQFQFAAQHYVGCQKITLDMVNGLRGFNNNFIVVNYRLAFGTYENIPSYLEGNDWINDWETVNPHTDWFITDPGSPNSGGRIRQSV